VSNSFLRKPMSYLYLCIAIASAAAPAAGFAKGGGGIIQFPPAGGGSDIAYKDLVCTEEDRAKIYEIVSTIANNPKLSLLFSQSHLRQLGQEINHVHPLKFLATVFSNSELKSSMYYVFDDGFKRSGFMDGLGPSLDRESQKGKLAMYLKDFAAEVSVSPESLQEYFKSRDWDNMVRFLIRS